MTESDSIRREVNPVKMYRHLIHMTQQELAKKADVSRTLVTRTEDGFMAQVPHPVGNVIYWKLVERASFNFRDFNDFYQNLNKHYSYWQYRIRLENRYRLIKPLIILHDQSDQETILNKHPWTRITYPANVNESCRWFCLQQQIINKWVTKPEQITEVPVHLIEVLRQIDIPETLINAFSEVYRAYHKQIAQQLISYSRKKRFEDAGHSITEVDGAGQPVP